MNLEGRSDIEKVREIMRETNKLFQMLRITKGTNNKLGIIITGTRDSYPTVVLPFPCSVNCLSLHMLFSILFPILCFFPSCSLFFLLLLIPPTSYSYCSFYLHLLSTHLDPHTPPSYLFSILCNAPSCSIFLLILLLPPALYSSLLCP